MILSASTAFTCAFFDADVANVCNGDNTILVHLGMGNGSFGSGTPIDFLAGGQSPPGRRRILSASTADPQVMDHMPPCSEGK